MLSRDLAIALRDAGLRWTPVYGDRFLEPDRDLDDEMFVLSDMVIEAVRLPDGTPALPFNGITEWAFDAFESSELFRVPDEEQLRALLVGTFESLEPLP